MLNPTLPPSGNFNLSTWNLTLPTGKKDHPDVIPTPQLSKHPGGYTSPYFFTGKDGAMCFWAPVNGVTTSGSDYPRSELRETNPDGSLHNWPIEAGVATLTATVAVNQIPSSGKVVIGQIHDTGAGGVSDQPLIKLQFNKGLLQVQVRPTPASDPSPYETLFNPEAVLLQVQIGQQFSYQLRTETKNGVLKLTVHINGMLVYSETVDASWKSQSLYFKAGSYCQDHSGPSSEGSLVSFYALVVTHE